MLILRYLSTAHNNLGLALTQQGRLDEAVSHFSEALQIRPDFPDAQVNLERALLLRENAQK